jgi:hypothetical protein
MKWPLLTSRGKRNPFSIGVIVKLLLDTNPDFSSVSIFPQKKRKEDVV